MKDASILFRDMAADGAGKITTKVRPGEEALAQIDAPAADNTWHEAPKLSKEDLKIRAQAVYKKSKPADTPDVDTTTASVVDGAHEVGKNKASEYRTLAQEYLSTKIPQERRDQAIWRLKVSPLLSQDCGSHGNPTDNPKRKWSLSVSNTRIISKQFKLCWISPRDTRAMQKP